MHIMSDNKVAIIVVTYNPDILVLQNNIATYMQQANLTLLVDNSDDNSIRSNISKFADSLSNVKLIQLPENTGIANAQNVGIEFLIVHGFEYYIEIDQDTQLPEDYVASMIESFVLLSNDGHKIGGIGPIAISKETGEPYHRRTKNIGIIEVPQTLSSGFFSSIEVCKQVGSKNNDFFIDYVDWEWCWRARRLGYNIYVNTDINITHMLGDGHKQFLFFKIGISSPIREYYTYRNSLYLIFGNIAPASWKIKRIFIHLLKPLLYLSLPDGFLRIRYLSKGLIDFLLGKKGKYN